MKNILGLDLGTTSIGFAHVIEIDNDPSKSEIKQIGVRVNPLSTDEQTNFEKGKPISINADRTLKRGARRTLDRYQDRRSNLIHALYKANIITKDTKLAEDGKNTTHSTYALRAKSVHSKIAKDEFARVLLAINKKRGYKSSRKAGNDDEGKAVDGMGIAKRLYEEGLTPGQLAYQLLNEGKKRIPDFYRSDLQAELDKIWDFQNKVHPEILTDEFKKEISGKGQKATSAIFYKTYGFNTAENKAKTRDEKKLQAYKWRSEAFDTRLEKEEVAFVITEINSNLNNSSGYLGAISDRSKELYFNNETVGEYLHYQLQKSPHTKLKNQVFYRQDYMDEFESIWTEQAKHHTELTEELKSEIRDIIIFYQRKLKSQKGLVSFCEFESSEIEIEKNGQKTKKTIGLKVAPKSSPLFQEFKVWQRLNDVVVRKKGSKKRTGKKVEVQSSLFEDDKEVFSLDLETKESLFEELNLKGNLNSNKIIELLGQKPTDWEINFSELEGNRTNAILYNAYLKILEIEGYNEDLLKLSDKDDINVAELKTPAIEIKDMVRRVFEVLGIDISILEFDTELQGKAFEQQTSYQLWHLLYSAEDDTKKYGEEDKLLFGTENIGLKKQLCSKFGFKQEHAKIMSGVVFSDDYGSLSSKAMRRIITHLKQGFAYGGSKDKPNEPSACEFAGYKHSAGSLTKEEIENRPLKEKLELLKKNSLRNPVVEKILNQVVNVVNTLIEKNSTKDENGKIINPFHFDEIRIELARELKKNAKEREELSLGINAGKIENDKIREIIKKEFPNVKNLSKNDIVRYKLYQELTYNGYKDLYTDTKIDYYKLFGKDYDIDHIIPQSKVFDDSFSNKVLVPRQANLDKGNKTAYDYLENKSEEALLKFTSIVELLFKDKKISKAKYQKLLKKESEIGDGFIQRDLRDSQYIAKKARQMLYNICRVVTPTTGSITNRLREDWDLINIMQELNFEKYKALGLTEMVEKKDGSFKERIIDWSKRNDHRHHAMDALTVAFTKHSHIQYLNHLNARKDKKNKLHAHIIGIENKETKFSTDEYGNRKRKFNEPISNFRQLAKEHLESILVSHKAKNKVVTKNKNKTKSKTGEKTKVELTPRGQLHKETVYGKYRYYVSKEEKVSAKFDLDTISKVANPTYKKLLTERLEANSNDTKKAFTGKNALDKNPIYLDETHIEQVPEKVQLVWLEEDFSIRKDVTPDNFKDEKTIEKVLDKAVKDILLKRYRDNNGDPKKAFSDLEKNPIWLNIEKGIAIKRVTISGVNNAEPLHFKKDHLGNQILDKKGKVIPVDFVSTGNNHHVAIYQDEKGNLQERVVSLFEAVQMVNSGEPIISKDYNQGIGWQFLFTMKQNEYFVFPNDKADFNPKETDLLDPKNAKKISPNLFRVQKFSTKDYWFRHHLETNIIDKNELNGITYHRKRNPQSIKDIIKVRLNHLGVIVKVGEY